MGCLRQKHYICTRFLFTVMEKISVVINTFNAARHLPQVLTAVQQFDEIVVCDMESTDNTCAIAREAGCRVITFVKGDCCIVEPARQYAIDAAQHQWVLVVDADEVVPDALRLFLYNTIRRPDAPAGVAIPRKNYFMGRFLHSCYPDYILRFFRKDAVHWPPVIHTSPQINGRVGYIPARQRELAFEHLANDSVSDILRKTNTYSDYELPRRRHKHYGVGALLSRPFFRFFKSYILKKGFLDGIPGLVHALLDAIYQTVIVAKLLEERTTGVEPREK